MLGTVIAWLILGLIAGFIARALVPGRQHMTIPQTALLGVIGSLIGGFLGHFLFHHPGGFVQPSGWIGSIVGSVLALLGYLQLEQRRA